MNEEAMNLETFLPALQEVLIAPDSDRLRRAISAVNGHLAIIPVEQVLSQSGQLTELSEQHLMDTIQNSMDLVLLHTQRECGTAYHDWQLLRRPVFPLPIMSPAARNVLGVVEGIQSLSEYDRARQEVWAQLQALDDGEREAVSGHLSRKLAELLIRKLLPELICQKDDTAMRRQFDLWSQLLDCRRHGLDNLAVYFLQAVGNRVRVLLPPAMECQNDAEVYYSCARTLSVLYHQISVCQREELFRGLLQALEGEVMHGVLRGEPDEAFTAIRDLYLSMRAEKYAHQPHYWETVCYARHALNKNNKEEN